eukprot:Phypoly_transcript_08467.p1 GENE.Phypoly_transcript_08467~~Phypoly_transcript_08467.p1  ORF type:complete len:340 (+),score=62.52 Phypoly_transcript_08467:197-1216(+)
MLGLSDYLSDDEDTPTKSTTPTPAPSQEKKTPQSNKRVINVSLPLAFNRDDDDEEEARPAKKANAGSSLASLLPAPKASVAISEKKPTKSAVITPSTSSSSSKPSTPTTTIKAGYTKPVARTANPLLHLHRNSTSTPAPVESTDSSLSDDPFFPIADPTPPPHLHVHSTLQETPYPQPSQQAPTQHSYPTTEIPAPHYPQPQEYNVPYYPEQDQYTQSQQYHQQPQQFEYYDPNTTPQGITAPYKGRNKREPDFNEFGANIIEVNQKDMLSKNRPGYSEASRLAEIRRAKMSVPAPKPSKLQRSRHQLTAMVYLFILLLFVILFCSHFDFTLSSVVYFG